MPSPKDKLSGALNVLADNLKIKEELGTDSTEERDTKLSAYFGTLFGNIFAGVHPVKKKGLTFTNERECWLPSTLDDELDETTQDQLRHLSRVVDRPPRYAAVHYHHSFLPESRITTSLVGSVVEEMRNFLVDCYRELKKPDHIEAAQGASHEQMALAYSELVKVYFELVGRRDSISDAVLRASAQGGPQTLTLAIEEKLHDDALLKVWIRKEGERVDLKVSEDLYRLLVGREEWLQKILVPYVWEKVLSGGADLGPEGFATYREELDERCFFRTRESLLDAAAATAFQSPILRGRCRRLSKALMTGETAVGQRAEEPDNKKRKVAAETHRDGMEECRKIMGLLQAAAIFRRIGLQRFTVLAVRDAEGNSRSHSGITLEGLHRPKTLKDVTKASYQVFSRLDEHLQLQMAAPPPDDIRRFLMRHVAVPDEEPESQSGLEDRRQFDREREWMGEYRAKIEEQCGQRHLPVESFLAFLHLGRQLLGSLHEGSKLTFRIALGADAVLRQVFEPVTKIVNRGGPDTDPFSVFLTLDHEATWRSELDRFGSIIQGNYSFLQKPDVFACLSSVRRPMEGRNEEINTLRLRYLAKISSQAANGWTGGRATVRKMTRLSKRTPDVMLLEVDEDSAYVALGGGLLAAIARGETKWTPQHRDNVPRVLQEFEDAAARIDSRNGNAQKLRKFLESETTFLKALSRVVGDIQRDPQAGATFVIGTWVGDLEEAAVEMTEVIDMVPDWRLADLADDPTAEEYLFDLAIQDGATVIAIDEGRVYGSRQLVNFEHDAPFSPTTWRPHGEGPTLAELWRADGDYAWEYGSWYKWGTRHRSAAGAAFLGRGERLVVCISQDGPVHLFDGVCVRRLL